MMCYLGSNNFVCLHVDNIMELEPFNFAASIIKTRNKKFQIGSNEVKKFNFVRVNVRISTDVVEPDQEH